MTNTASELNYVELARQIAARMSPEALLSAEDVGAMLGYPARYIRETIALALGFPVAMLPTTSVSATAVATLCFA
jgi:hypothetical protein